MSVTEPLVPSPRPVVAIPPDLEADQLRPSEASSACPYTDDEIDAIFDAWKR
jgi:hypothetical protein